MFQRSRLPRLAMILCVRNEQRFLRENLLYHHAVGVERAYVFLDRCTDRCEQIAGEFPWAKVSRLDPDESERFVYITDLHIRCMDVALAWAREEGFDWLLMIDADELAFADNLCADPSTADVDRLLADASLPPLLAGVPPEILQVKLTTREILPCRERAHRSFYRQSYFHGDAPFQRTFYDLVRQEKVAWTGFFGHHQGKSIIRTSAHVQGHDSHRWTPRQAVPVGARPEYAPLPTLEKGWHAHYFITCKEHWFEKTPKHLHQPAHWPCQSPVERPIQTWKDAAQSVPLAERDRYCDRWVLIAEETLRQAIEAGSVVEDIRIPRIMEHLLCQAASPAAPAGEPPTIRLASLLEPGQAGGETTTGLYDFSPAKLLPESLEGFYPVELHHNVPFRWSQPEAAIRLSLPPGTYRLVGQSLPGFARSALESLSLHFDGQPVEDLRIDVKRHRFTAIVMLPESAAAADHTLALAVAQAPQMPGDARKLGLPIQTIQFRHVLGLSQRLLDGFSLRRSPQAGADARRKSA